MNRYYLKASPTKTGIDGPVYLCRETDTANGPLFCPDSGEDFCGEWCPFFEVKQVPPESNWRLTLLCRPVQRHFFIDEMEIDDEEV